MAWIDIELYGSNTDLTGETPDLASVLALADVESETLSVDVVNAMPLIEIEKVQYLNDRRRTVKVQKIQLEPEIRTNFPASATDFETYYIWDVLEKPYLWLDLTDYDITLHEADKVLSVNLTGYEVEHDRDKGRKKIKLTFETR